MSFQGGWLGRWQGDWFGPLAGSTTPGSGGGAAVAEAPTRRTPTAPAVVITAVAPVDTWQPVHRATPPSAPPVVAPALPADVPDAAELVAAIDAGAAAADVIEAAATSARRDDTRLRQMIAAIMLLDP